MANPDSGNGVDHVKSLVEQLIENTFETLTEEDSKSMDSEMMIFTGVKISEYMLNRYKSMDKLYKRSIKNS
jgi:hypoxanthine phosphoribosyltransferase